MPIKEFRIPTFQLERAMRLDGRTRHILNYSAEIIEAVARKYLLVPKAAYYKTVQTIGGDDYFIFSSQESLPIKKSWLFCLVERFYIYLLKKQNGN